jgi:hypothetical protein
MKSGPKNRSSFSCLQDKVGVERREAARKRPFFEFSLCLSRACLGKKMNFIYKWLKKPVFSPAEVCGIAQQRVEDRLLLRRSGEARQDGVCCRVQPVAVLEAALAGGA